MDDASEKRLLPPHAKIEDYADALLDGEKERLRVWSEKRFAKLPGFSFDERARFYGQIYKARFESEPALGQQFLRTLIYRRKPSIGYHLLARILNRKRHNVVITTNFDHLVEDSIAITENEAVQSFGHTDLAAYLQSRPAHPVVAKIHGDILLKSYNATEEIETLGEPWRNALHALFQTYTPIVVGYGGNDPGFMGFFMKEMKSWGQNRRCYWLLRKGDKFESIPFSSELAGINAFRLVECPGFTELMLKLNEIFNLEPLHEDLKKRADTIAVELREADAKARGELADLERRSLESIRASGETVEGAVTTTLGTATPPPEPARRSWRDWLDVARSCGSASAQKETLVEAIKALPGNRPLQAAMATLDLQKDPSNTSLLDAISGWLKESESALGPESDETLTVLHCLATSFNFTGAYEKAEPIFRRVIAARQRVLGPEHPDTLTSRNNLATALRVQGKHAEAENEYRAVLAMRQSVLGPEHPHTLGSRSNLAFALYDQGKLAEAENEHRAVLGIRLRVLGPEHPGTLGSRNNSAFVLRAQGKHAEAESEYRAVLGIRQRVLGPEHPDTLVSRNNLAVELYNQDKHAEGETEHRAVLAIRQRVLGPEHADVSQSCHNLALCLRSQGKKAEALEFAKRALAGYQKSLGEAHPDTQNTMKLVALLEQES